MTRVKWGVALAVAIALCSVPAPVTATPGDPPFPQTLTFWCADLNQVWHAKVPLVGPRGWFVPPDPPPIPDPCISPYPAVVPEGSSFAPGNVLWFTNKTYPPAVRAALGEMGYHFHSQSPAEDFRSKLTAIRVEVRTYPENELVGESTFDPWKFFRLVRVRNLFFGPADLGPLVIPDLGIDLSAEEVGRLPMFGFPTVLPPPGPPREYRIWVYLTMSDWHDDGLGVAEENMLPAGEFLYAAPRLTVVP
jgi:hypothetical protein